MRTPVAIKALLSEFGYFLEIKIMMGIQTKSIIIAE
jgi:hypothetical protein